MKLSIEVTIPTLKPVIRNEAAVVAKLGDTLAERVRARARAGQGWPARRTGQLINSIAARSFAGKDGKPEAVVGATGMRSDPGKKRQISNAALAAILSSPPKDKRSQNGGRAVYPLFRFTEQDLRELAQITTREARLEFVQTGTTTIKR